MSALDHSAVHAASGQLRLATSAVVPVTMHLESLFDAAHAEPPRYFCIDHDLNLLFRDRRLSGHDEIFPSAYSRAEDSVGPVSYLLDETSTDIPNLGLPSAIRGLEACNWHAVVVDLAFQVKLRYRDLRAQHTVIPDHVLERLSPGDPYPDGKGGAQSRAELEIQRVFFEYLRGLPKVDFDQLRRTVQKESALGLRYIREGRADLTSFAPNTTGVALEEPPTVGAAEPDVKSIPKVKGLDPVREQRDKWLYDEWLKGTRVRRIVSRLRTKPKCWPRLNSHQGVSRAAARYAERHGLEAPTKRKKGRPPQAK